MSEYRPEAPRPYDIAFVGNMNPSVMPHRVAFFTKLAHRLERRLTIFVGKGSVREIYPKAKMVINFSTRPVWSYGENPRLLRLRQALDINFRTFEAMGHGAMLLADTPSTDLRRLFRKGEHFDVYEHNNLEDAVERIEYHLAHTEERIAIARRGWEEVLRSHTTAARGAQLASLLERAASRTLEARSPEQVRYALGRALLRAALHDSSPAPELKGPMVTDRLARARALLESVEVGDRQHVASHALIPLFDAIEGNPRKAGDGWMALWSSRQCPVAASCLEAFFRWAGEASAADRLADWRRSEMSRSVFLEWEEEAALRELLYIVFQQVPRLMRERPSRTADSPLQEPGPEPERRRHEDRERREIEEQSGEEDVAYAQEAR